MLHVTVHEDIQTVRNLKHGEETEMHFLVKRDTDYQVYVEFLSGRKISKEVGYLTSGLNPNDIITVTQTDVEFEAGLD